MAGKRILVVEDEFFIASDLNRALGREGAIVIGPVGQLEKGMSLANSERIDAAILDVNLDGKMSYPLADRLTELAVPYLFVTGYDGWSMPKEYDRLPRIAKPFSMMSVVDTMVTLVTPEHSR
ncbi:response regulator [Sphingomonas sp. DBB INV C78]|uniref:response regulator n=1 Tax=Sphingomonas sp. DBB INV C78 TaxID=3349434 RepID=UPI0036D34B22